MKSRYVEEVIEKARRLLAQGADLEAMVLVSGLVDKFPMDHRPLAFRAHVHRVCGEYDNSIQDLDKAISINATDPYLFHFRGQCLMRTGNLQMAIADFTRGLALCDELGDEWYRETLLFFRAEAYIRLGQKTAARNDLDGVRNDFTFWIDRLRNKSELLADCE
jgi:tetratricopeptide (TPR) repeat protein